MQQNTYLFYDIETTGLNKAFDQVLQFAAIRTDMQLNELERHEILVKLSPDVIPSPMALLTNQIAIADLQNGVSEMEAIYQIHQLMNQPGTISLGYNTLGFDDEFLRFSFYRHLLPAYTHQYANNCSRMDLYPMTIMYFLFKKEVINWPVTEPPSMKLEHINNANQLATGAAHNAIVDVCATVELAKRFFKADEMWKYLRGYFEKNTVIQRLSKFNEGLIVDGSLGAKQHYQSPVLNLGNHNHYRNQTLWLRLDKPELAETTSTTIPEKTWIFRTKLAENSFLLPFTEHYSEKLTQERREIMHANKQWLEKNPALFQAITHYHREYKYPKIPYLDASASLYENGFLSDHEQRLCAEFHRAPINKKSDYIEKFSNNNLRELVIRMLGRHDSAALPDKFSEEYQQYLKNINPEKDEDALVDYRGKKRTTPKAVLAEIKSIKNKEDSTPQQLKLLNDLEKYLTENF